MGIGNIFDKLLCRLYYDRKFHDVKREFIKNIRGERVGRVTVYYRIYIEY